MNCRLNLTISAGIDFSLFLLVALVFLLGRREKCSKIFSFSIRGERMSKSLFVLAIVSPSNEIHSSSIVAAHLLFFLDDAIL